MFFPSLSFSSLSSCVFPLAGFRRQGDSAHNNIVPYNLQNSILLHDKLVEVPPTAKSPTVASPGSRSEGKLARHELVLQQHRQAPPRVVEWLELKDTASNRIFYHNKMTGKSLWDKPAGFDEAVSIAAREEAKRGTFWIQVEDSKGRKYYYDLLTKEARWDRPSSFMAPPRESSMRVRRSSSRMSGRFVASKVDGGDLEAV